MSLHLNLSRELQRRLNSEAIAKGLKPEEYAAQILAAELSGGSRPGSGASVVAEWKMSGVIGSRVDISDAAKHAHKIRRRATRRDG